MLPALHECHAVALALSESVKQDPSQVGRSEGLVPPGEGLVLPAQSVAALN